MLVITEWEDEKREGEEENYDDRKPERRFEARLEWTSILFSIQSIFLGITDDTETAFQHDKERKKKERRIRKKNKKERERNDVSGFKWNREEVDPCSTQWPKSMTDTLVDLKRNNV